MGHGAIANLSRWVLTNRGLCFLHLGELHDTAALGASAFVQDLGKLDLASRFKELDQILVRRGPGQLPRNHRRQQTYTLAGMSLRRFKHLRCEP